METVSLPTLIDRYERMLGYLSPAAVVLYLHWTIAYWVRAKAARPFEGWFRISGSALDRELKLSRAARIAAIDELVGADLIRIEARSGDQASTKTLPRTFVQLLPLKTGASDAD